MLAQVLDAAELKRRAKKAAKRGRGKGGGGGAAAAKVSLYSISGRADVLEGLAGGDDGAEATA
eukprot:COSAG01_NODE_26454_length_713_cov_1.996743_1_plen_62_part_10